MPLLTRYLLVGFQYPIDPRNCRIHSPLLPFVLLPRFRHRIADRFAHHPPVHAQLLGYPFDRPGPMLVFTPDLFEYLHFALPPVQTTTFPGHEALEEDSLYLQEGGPNQSIEVGQFRVANSRSRRRADMTPEEIRDFASAVRISDSWREMQSYSS